MRVSVVIPAYNAAATIGRAVESCLRQTLDDLEIIVIDDGSSDGTGTAAEAAAAGDARLTVVRLSPNGGVSRARNAGIDRARGEWIALLDADDMFAPERLEMLVRRAGELRADLIADNLTVTHFSDRTKPAQMAFPPERMSAPFAISAANVASTDRPRWGLPASGFMKPLMRRAFLNEHGLRYLEDLHAGEDFHLYMQCLLRGARLFYVPDAHYIYTIHQSSLSRTQDDRVRTAILRSSRELAREAELAGDDDAARELRVRERDFTLWVSFKHFEAALEGLRLLDAACAFVRLPSKRYALLRLAGRARFTVLTTLTRIREQVRTRAPLAATDATPRA